MNVNKCRVNAIKGRIEAMQYLETLTDEHPLSGEEAHIQLFRRAAGGWGCDDTLRILVK